MELLAPANAKTFFESINNGADAVYFGLNNFSARASADNISLENLDYYVSYAHLFGVKVYCAVNTLVKNSEINDFINTIISAYNKGVDAFILQDIFLGKYIKDIYPEIELHLSTQAGVNNIFGAKLAKEFGFSRVILSRETAKEEIKEIASFIETEVFIHGALCSSFSGHCYYSSYIGGNSGNRGRCKQPCRQPFVYNDNKKIPLGKYNLSLSDLMLCDYVQELKDLGVKSFKIEGRMRSEEYVACAVRLYRNAIDNKSYKKELLDIKSIYNRGDYTCGYYKRDKKIISDKIQSHKGDFFANVIKVNNNFLLCDKNANNGDCFKIIRNGYEIGNSSYINGKYQYKGEVKVGDSLYITKNVQLINEYVGKKRLKDIDLYISIENDRVKAIYKDKVFISDSIVQDSINIPTSKNDIIANFLKVDNYPFKAKITLNYNEDKFIPKSLLNAFRRNVFASIFNIQQNKKTLKRKDNISDFTVYSNAKTIVMTEDFSCCDLGDIFVLYPNDYKKLDSLVVDNKFKNLKETYIFIPAFLNNKDYSLIKPYLNYFKGVYADGLCGLQIAKENNMPVIVGLGLNIFNSISYNVAFKEFNVTDVIVSKELTNKEYFGGNTLFFGKISLMEFVYCPFRQNCDICSKNTYFNCNDKYENFVLRRVGLSSCRFQLLTEKVFIGENGTNKGKFINLIGLNKEEVSKVNNFDFKGFKRLILKEVL